MAVICIQVEIQDEILMGLLSRLGREKPDHSPTHDPPNGGGFWNQNQGPSDPGVDIGRDRREYSSAPWGFRKDGTPKRRPGRPAP
jgi:hypothetical protein